MRASRAQNRLDISILLCFALLAAAATARADEAATAPPGTNNKVVPAATPISWSSQPMLTETSLVPVEPAVTTPSEWNGDIDAYHPIPFFQRRLAQHREFVQPFLNSSVFPDVVARLDNVAGWNPRNSSGEMDQYAYFSFYLLELYAPVFTFRDSSPVSPDHFRMNLRIPYIINEHNAIAWFGSVNIPVSGTWTQTGGASTYFGYAFGTRAVSFQLRAGVGYDQLVGELTPEAPIGSSFMYDATVGVPIGRHFEVIGEVDGRKLIGRSGATFRAFPGVRFYPLSQETLHIGLSGLYWMDDYNPGGVGAFRTRRAGAMFDFGYTFL